MKFNSPPENRRSSVVKRCLIWTATLVVPVILIFSYSETAHASLLSFFNGLWGSRQASADVSQTLFATGSESTVLPSPSTNINPTSTTLTDTPPIHDSEVLDADIAATNQAGNDQSLNTQISTYLVQPGDTLSDISTIFDISVGTIQQANNLGTSKSISPGQTLIILPVSGILYTVKPGDSVQKIAAAYEVSADDIVAYNNLGTLPSLSAGQQLVIPHAKAVSAPASISHKVPSSEPVLGNPSSWPAYGGYSCPVPGARLSQGLHGHNAVDLAIAVGTPIHASMSGTIITDRTNGLWNGGYGNFVIILHSNGTQTLYAHMRSPSSSHPNPISIGEQVSQGQTIGYVGMTGETTGPHVHFEIRGAQNPFVNPALCQ